MNIDPNGKGWIDWAATKVSVVSPDGDGGGEGRHSHALYLGPQLSGLTSTLPDTVLSHLFSQVRAWGPSSTGTGVARQGVLRRLRQLLKGLVLPPPSRAGGGELGFCGI